LHEGRPGAALLNVVKMLSEERFQARIEGVDELGRLLVKKEGGGLALASSEARIEALG
jgi:hypothetical protein